MISFFGNDPRARIHNGVGRGQPVIGRGQRASAMQEGLLNLSGSRLGDGVVDTVGSFIQSQASQGATAAVQPYIIGSLMLGAGALLVSLIALADVKKLSSKRGLSGARTRR